MKSYETVHRLHEAGLFIFSKREFERFFEISQTAATFFLHRHCRTGLFVRLKNGLYALSNPFPSEEEIANRLYQPSYLSFEYVLARHGVLPESVYTIISATTKPSRQFEVEGKIYQYSSIKREAFTGYHSQRIHGRTVLIATPEKALVDYLYFVDLKKRPWNDRLDTSSLSKKEIRNYAQLFGRLHLTEKIKELL